MRSNLRSWGSKRFDAVSKLISCGGSYILHNKPVSHWFQIRRLVWHRIFKALPFSFPSSEGVTSRESIQKYSRIISSMRLFSNSNSIRSLRVNTALRSCIPRRVMLVWSPLAPIFRAIFLSINHDPSSSRSKVSSFLSLTGPLEASLPPLEWNPAVTVAAPVFPRSPPLNCDAYPSQCNKLWCPL